MFGRGKAKSTHVSITCRAMPETKHTKIVGGGGGGLVKNSENKSQEVSLQVEFSN